MEKPTTEKTPNPAEPQAPDPAKTPKARQIIASVLGSQFQLDTRTQGWLPDISEGRRLFEDESLGESFDEKTLAFEAPINEPETPEPPPPTDPTQETDREKTLRAWNDLYKSILGEPLGPNPEEPFDKALEDIAQTARRYNAALYCLRRLHFRRDHAQSELPPPNPHGLNGAEPQVLPDPATDPDPFKKLAADTETNYTDIVNEMNSLLSGKLPDRVHGFTQIYADMIQVNGYIVSMRIVANDPKKAKSNEPNGSSSHHRISSPFKAS